MNVVLIGYRACGKSTVGKLLAEKLKFAFLDTDLMIEENAGMTIKKIVAGHGWDYFRAGEKEVIQKLAQKNECVIATGGGAVLDEENVALLKKTGVVVWLNASLADIIERLQEDANAEDSRPKFSDYDLAEETAMVIRERLPLYRKTADFVLDTTGKSAAQVMEEIYQHVLESAFPEKSRKHK